MKRRIKKLRNIIQNKSVINAKLTTTMSISLVLFLLGLITLLTITARSLSVYVKENISFNIMLNENINESDIKKLQKKLDMAPYVKSTEMITKEQALNDLANNLGENPQQLLGFNPTRPSIEVFLKSGYANKDSIASIEKQVKALEENVEDVLYREDVIHLVNENVRTMGLILGILALILLIISIALINNTIELSIYSKRFLINTMRLVGATGSFIRKPFVRDNIFSGVVASFIAITLLMGLIYYVSKEIRDFIDIINLQAILLICLVILIAGILITGLSSYFSVNKYLRMKNDRLYE
ncbi:MAG: permease-like cell division protein FtsX [Candidatus Azobacteroides sp.]|nr:permease-like cell division protein FtsX [Candidatus Azobacteroides sp.]